MRRERIVRGIAFVALIAALAYYIMYLRIFLQEIRMTFRPEYSLILSYVAVPMGLLSCSLLVTPSVVAYNELIGHFRTTTRTVARLLGNPVVAIVSLLMMFSPLLVYILGHIAPGLHLYESLLVRHVGAVVLGASIACMLSRESIGRINADGD